jgi:predicted MFS family arabinose efflux permease
VATTATPAGGAALRRLLIVACAVVITDTAFYAVITPLLPHYADEFGLSKAGLGLLAATYSAGIVLAAVPSGLLVARVGPRATMVTAMALLAVACVMFGFGGSYAVLLVARFMQGVAGSLAWAGAFAWVIDAAPAGRRGKMIGTLLAAAVAGGLIGPPFGALGEAVGTRALFGSVVVLCAAVALASLTLPAPERHPAQGLAAVGRALRQWPVVLAGWLTVLAGVNFGVITVVGAIRLDHLGAGALGIAAVFCVTAAAEGFLNPLVGGIADRRGAVVPIRLGLAVAGAAFCVFALPTTYLLQGAVVLVSLCATAAFWGPSMTLLSDSAGRTGLQQGMIVALANLAWAAGNVAGAYGGGAMAGATGEVSAAVAASVLATGSLAAVLQSRRRLVQLAA